MPLALTRRKDSAVWWITGTIAGRRIRESTGRTDRAQAEDVLAARAQREHRAAVFGREAVVTFAEAVTSYKNSVQPSPSMTTLLMRLNDFFGRSLLREIDQVAIDRAIRALCRPGAAPATRLRNVITPVTAVLNHAARRGWCPPPKFEKPKGSVGIKRTRWLTPEEWGRLHDAAALHLRPLLTFLVGTGCRLSEALELDWDRVDLAHARAVVWQKQQNERVLELPPSVVVTLANMVYRARDPLTGRLMKDEDRRPVFVVERTGTVFRSDDGIGYADHGRRFGGQIGTAWDGACRRARIAGASPHTLRHTWASWRYAFHRDPMRLRDEGGWATLAQVERYAKLVPETMLPGILAAWGMSGTFPARPTSLTVSGRPRSIG